MNPGPRILLAALCGITVTAASNAATIDLVSYLGLTPGNWAMFQDVKTGAVAGSAVSQNPDGTLSQTWYRLEGNNWTFDGAQRFSVSSRKLTFVGQDDGTVTWAFEPAFSFPRRQQVGDSSVYKGVLRNPVTGEAIGVTLATSITAANISVTVPAGTFANCIKFRNYNYGGGLSRDSVSINCPGRSEVKSWYNKIKDTPVPTEEDQSQSHSGVMIQAGDSNPPFP